jgi:DNA ligase (NAD+)
MTKLSFTSTQINYFFICKRKLGAEVSSTVSKDIDYVVIGEKPGSKYNKAQKLGIKIISEEKFEEIIRE